MKILYSLNSRLGHLISLRYRKSKTYRSGLLIGVMGLLILAPVTLYLARVPKTAYADSLLKLDEGSGDTVYDANGNTSGSITNAVWKTQELCKFGNCLYFDGTGDYVSIADDASLDMAASDTVTVELWFRTPDISSGTRTLVAKEEATGSDGGYRIQMNSSGQIVFGIDSDNDSFPVYSVTSPSAYDDNNWHFISAVKNGTASMTLYIDTLHVGTTSIASTDASNDDSLYIGIYNGSSDGFTGFIDEVKILRTARTADQVKTDYVGQTPEKGTSASFGPDQTWLSNGLVGYWKMDETTWGAPNCTANVVSDYSGNGLHLLACPATTGPQGGNTGKYGCGVTFDGSNDYLTVDDPGSSPLDLTNTLTLSAWVYPTSLPSEGSYSTILIKDVFAGNYAIQFKGSKLAFLFFANGGWHEFISESTFSPSTWYNTLVTFDDSSKKINIYINGRLDKTYTTTYSLTATDNGLCIGSACGGEVFIGTIDEVRVYNRALTPAEVIQLYNWAPGPVVYYKFDQQTIIEE